MTFEEASAALTLIHGRFKGAPDKLEIAMQAMKLAVPNLRWCATDDGAAIVQSLDETKKLMCLPPTKED